MGEIPESEAQNTCWASLMYEKEIDCGGKQFKTRDRRMTKGSIKNEGEAKDNKSRGNEDK